MRLTGPTLRDELRSTRFRPLRVFLWPAVLAAALYAFYVVGGYRTQDAALKPLLHGSIYGTVVDEKQRPVSGVSVTISFSSSRDPLPDSAPATDGSGHFYLKDLPAGSYILQTAADGFEMQTQTTYIAPGKTTRLKLPIYRIPGSLQPPRP